MKEYYLVPTKEYNNLIAGCNDKNSSKIKETKFLESDKLSPEILLTLYDKIKNDNIAMNNINTMEENDKIPEIKQENGIESLLLMLKSDIRQAGRHIIESLLQNDDVQLDNYGLLHIKNADRSIRIEDLLRMILIKGSSIKKYEDVLKNIISLVPDIYISNKKLLEFKNSLYTGGGTCCSKQFGGSKITDNERLMTTQSKPKFIKKHVRMIIKSKSRSYKNKWIHI
jgi:hypothetical protein